MLLYAKQHYRLVMYKYLCNKTGQPAIAISKTGMCFKNACTGQAIAIKLTQFSSCLYLSATTN